MISWVAGYFPDSRRQAFLCSSGSNGYSAFKRSLEPGYPEHTILLTNVDLLDVQELTQNATKVNDVEDTDIVSTTHHVDIVNSTTTPTNGLPPVIWDRPLSILIRVSVNYKNFFVDILRNITHIAPISNTRTLP